MKTKRMNSICIHLLVTAAIALSSACTYMKVNPPPDADKVSLAGNNSCWLATAANMLAGAGYGDGASVQARTDDIYGDMTTQYGTANGGWTDTALTWWLGSANNTWPSNPYTVVTVYGNKSPRYPWANANGARDIGNELRKCNYVGLSISWPTDAAGAIGSGGHAITGWGDRAWVPGKGRTDPLSSNPGEVRLTDSDNETGGDVQQYDYDAYTNPNPGGANEGNGWYIDYDPNHPYIKHIAVLSPALSPGGAANIQRVVGSYKIHQNKKTAATDLHYTVGTDADILSYLTWVNWDIEAVPNIVDSQPQRRSLEVDWDFREKPIPSTNWVTITTEFILRNWNAIQYSDVHFTYPDGVMGMAMAPIDWEIRTPEIAKAATIPNVSGGYVVAGFDIINTALPAGETLVGKYRLLHQYSFTQSPEKHTLLLKGREGFQIANLRVGHSYGMVEPAALWQFEGWMTRDDKTHKLGDDPIKLNIDWSGQLPYPKGEDIENRIRDLKQGLRTKRGN